MSRSLGRRDRRRGYVPLVVFWVLMICVPEVMAQQQALSVDRREAAHTLVIRDGVLWVDGERQPEEDVPVGLDLEGLEMHLELPAGGSATVELGDRTYAIEEGRLVPAVASPQQAQVRVFFRQNGDVVPAEEAVRRVQPTGMADRAASSGSARAPNSATADIVRQSQALEAQVQALVTSDIEQLRREQLERQVALLHQQAASLSAAANRLPQTEVQNYFDVLRTEDAALFQKLQKEWELEASTLRLAREIRRTHDPARRVELNEALRRRLDRVFELKQQNRRREIEQLERELQTLTERLAERERLRDEIIQRRVEELTGEESQ